MKLQLCQDPKTNVTGHQVIHESMQIMHQTKSRELLWHLKTINKK